MRVNVRDTKAHEHGVRRHRRSLSFSASYYIVSLISFLNVLGVADQFTRIFDVVF